MDPDRTVSSQIGQAAEEGSVPARVADALVGGHFTAAFTVDPKAFLPRVPKGYAARIAREIKRRRLCR